MPKHVKYFLGRQPAQEELDALSLIGVGTFGFTDSLDINLEIPHNWTSTKDDCFSGSSLGRPVLVKDENNRIRIILSYKKIDVLRRIDFVVVDWDIAIVDNASHGKDTIVSVANTLYPLVLRQENVSFKGMHLNVLSEVPQDLLEAIKEAFPLFEQPNEYWETPGVLDKLIQIVEQYDVFYRSN